MFKKKRENYLIHSLFNRLVLCFSYELDNGQIFSETGELKTIGDQEAVVKSGAYSFVGADGVTYWVTYYADETGFHPTIGMF